MRCSYGKVALTAAPRLFSMQERPCTRCIKRNIGHLCHDEPREHIRRPKCENQPLAEHDEASPKQEDLAANDSQQPRDSQQQQPNQPMSQEPHLQVGPGRAFLSRPADTTGLGPAASGVGGRGQVSKANTQQRWFLLFAARSETFADHR